MKKALIGIIVALIVSMSASTVYAAADIQIKIDGMTIASDVKPEIKSNRVMVPIRVISENLGANVKWSNPEVIITKGEMQVTLSLNSSTAKINSEKVQLDVKPYAKNNRVFVPLRFITEVFEGTINYNSQVVTVNTPPLLIDGTQVKALQWEFRMTMGGMIQHLTANGYNEAVYNILQKHKGEEVEAPEHYSWMYLMDIPGAYNQIAQYDFLDAKDVSAASFGVYALVDAFPAELIEGYPKMLIHDVTSDKWFLFSKSALDSIAQLMDEADKKGALKVISNTIV